MTTRRSDLVTSVLTRLGDLAQQIWTTDEVLQHLVNGYQLIACVGEVFYDWTYLENLPRGASYSQPWEQAMLGGAAVFDYGYANYSAAFELGCSALLDERQQYGPANYTSPFEATDGLLARCKASTAIPATADVPLTLVGLTRVTWDKRQIDAMEARRLSRVDSRYEITAGEVYGYIWQKDGIRTLRKVRVPAAQADTCVVNGAWGLLRTPTDLSTDTVTGSWGVCRRIPGQHPMGPDQFGAPRRPFLEGKNVRVEHTRHGRSLEATDGVCELPDRYAVYLRDYAMAMCLGRKGPGQDLKLAAHFQLRWTRGLARIQRRLQLVDAEHISVMGGDGTPLQTRPPRPKLPWAFGNVVR